ncbi:MAG: thymidine kinase, partial [Flavobacteriaceae bacterium]|nr:thymidine kinase [Flavobacteriaceae bacterium]
AHFSHRTVADDRLVLLGEVQEYEPLSRAAYYKELQKEKQKKEEEKNEQ